ncbi:MAG: sigma-54-dependent Fis family transcriptional regulator [Candidatus Saganbacteria bacterium]|nr:sigma-54-dependent Fis family transcriptional regulator [Candidatus Saganbacteria bacterium]
MNTEKPAILVIEDEQCMLYAYKALLEDSYRVVLASSAKDGLAKYKESTYSAVVLDLKLPDMHGLKVLEKIKSIEPTVEVIIATASDDTRDAVQAVKAGAFEYITKPFDADELLLTLERVMQKNSLVRENIYLRTTLDEQHSYEDLIGTTPVMQNIFSAIENIGPTNSTVLITGESGTGKELVAHAIHNKSLRRKRPFVIINCAAIPENLLESELFGHERGAFTGAIERKIGKFEIADRGTLFLDEIGCMSPSMQAKLLRVLESGKIERIGGEKPIETDVRILAATNLDLEKAIKEGDFRSDLYYRINVIPIRLPALKERSEDIPYLAGYFLNKFNLELKKDIKGFDPKVLEALKKYVWPGNVRELKNVIERAVVLAESDVISKIPLRFALDGCFISKSLRDSRAVFERNHILDILKLTDGNQSKAAKILEIHRTTLIAKMEQLGLR